VLAARGDALALRMGAPVTNTLVAVTAVDLAAPAMRASSPEPARVNDLRCRRRRREPVCTTPSGDLEAGRAPNFALTASQPRSWTAVPTG
jgi:hypothetical protein